MTDQRQKERRGIPVRCPLGGYAPCLDDVCHSGDRTMCGLYLGLDFCEHDCDPDTCPECDEEDYPDFGGDDWTEEQR